MGSPGVQQLLRKKAIAAKAHQNVEFESTAIKQFGSKGGKLVVIDAGSTFYNTSIGCISSVLASRRPRDDGTIALPLLDSHRPKRRSTKCVSVEDTNFPPLVNSARAYKFALRLSLMWLSNSNLDFILVLDSATHRTEAKLALLAQRHSRQGPSQKILSEHLDGELWPTDIVERVDAEFEKITGKTLEEARIRIVFAPHEADRAVIDEAERALLPPNEGGRGLTPADIAVISFDADLASMRTDACFGTLITQHRKGNQDVKSTSFSISYDIIDRKKLFKSEAMRWKTKLVLQFVVLANGQDYTGTGLAKVGLGTMDTTEFVEEVFGKWNKLEDPPLDDDEITEEHPNDDMDMDVDLSSLDILEQQIEHFLDFVQPRLLARITTKITHWRDLSPDQRDTGFDHFFNLVRAGLEVWNLEPEPVLIPRKTTEDAHLSTRAIASSAATASNLAPDLDRTQVQRFPRTSPYYKTQNNVLSPISRPFTIPDVIMPACQEYVPRSNMYGRWSA